MNTKAENMTTETREHMRGGDGMVSLTSLLTEKPQNCRLFSKIVLPEGASIGYHMHEKETELFYFMQGEAICRDDDREIALRAGDSLATGSGHGHAVKNVGKGDLILIACIILD